MTAGITDKFADTYNAANPNVARVTSTRAPAGLSLSCDNLAGWPTGTVVHFSTYKINTSSAVIAGSQIDWEGIVSGNNIGTMTRITGATDNGNAVNDVVEMNPTAKWASNLVNGILTSIDQDGTLKAGAVDNAAVLASDVVTTAKILDGNVTEAKLTQRPSEYVFDHIASGVVITADSAGVNKNYSITSGVVYLAGKRLTVAAVSAQTVGASKDRYIDLHDNGDGTAVYVTNEVANNAASQALTAGNLRAGIVVAGATTIAAATSVNQGQETMILPIASSIPYAVTDSLGNLICPRDPNRKLLGYRQIITDVTTASAASAQITGLTVPVIVPLGRKVKLTLWVGGAFSSGAAGTFCAVGIYDGVVGVGTQINIFGMSSTGVNNNIGASCIGFTTPTTSSKTYNAFFQTSAGTFHTSASATSPAYCLVELE